METSQENPRCPIDGAALICPSCRAREAGRKGGAVRSRKKAEAAKKAARRPETQHRRSAAQLAAWERRRAAAGIEAGPKQLRRKKLKPLSNPGEGATEMWTPHDPAVPLEGAPAARPEPADNHSSPGAEVAPKERRSSLAEALAKRRG